jgi:hypothetical protein
LGAVAVSTVVIRPSSAAGADDGVSGLGGSIGNTRVWNSRSGSGGIASVEVSISAVFCGAVELDMNIGTKMTASAINTAAPSRRCFNDKSMSNPR